MRSPRSSRTPLCAPRRARACAAAPDLARALARLAVGRGGPRDLAAIRDGILAAAELARALGALNEPPAEIVQAMRRGAAPGRHAGGRARGRARRRTAGLQARRRLRARRLRCLRSTSCARLRDESRRVIAALQARYAEETGVRALKVRAQQRARLFRRGHRPARRQADGGAAQRHLHPPPDAGRAGALHHHRARRARSQDRQRRRARARAGARHFRQAGGASERRNRRHQGLRRGADACSTPRRRSRIWRPSATMSARMSIPRSTS